MHEEYNITHVTSDGEINFITLSEENDFQWCAYFAIDERYEWFSTETCEENVWRKDGKIYRSLRTVIINAEEYKSEYFKYVMGGDSSWKQVEHMLNQHIKNTPE